MIGVFTLDWGLYPSSDWYTGKRERELEREERRREGEIVRNYPK